MHTIFVRSGQSTALFSVLSSCFKMASDRAKWSNDVHSHIWGTQSVSTQSRIGYSKCEHNTILFRYPGTGSRAPSVHGQPFRLRAHSKRQN